MKLALTLGIAVAALIAPPAMAQVTMAPAGQTVPPTSTTALSGTTPPADSMSSAPAAGATALTDKEQKLLTRCKRMEPAQQAQSSKCQAVMVKAGGADPAKSMQTSSQRGD